MDKFKQTISRYGILLFLLGALSYIGLNAFTYDANSAIEIQPKYSEVRIFAKNETDIKRMMDAGLYIDHANTQPGEFMDAWLSEYEISLLQKSGVPYQILIDDWMEYYENQKKMSEHDFNQQLLNDNNSISHSIFGSMGGYMTYAEVMSKLDSMRMWYPQFISTKFSIGTTYEGRTQWAVRVTHNPDAPTGRPQALYHALIHAREPESMEQQFYYFLWLCENYNTNLTAKYILDNREIYWVPVFNPDGYVYNQTTNPNGGGMWRANRHISTGQCGAVDPNRNFGTYQYWNSSNGGSSTDSCAGGQGTYRGRSPFSELETQNIMNFVNTHNFNSAASAHTYGNWMIKPWCWQDPIGTPDDAKYNSYFADMDYSNPAYFPGFPSQTVLYQVRGGTDDWYYNDSVHAGHHIFSYTPETGITFWPTQAYILPLAEGMLFNNQYWSLIAGPFVQYQSSNLNLPSYTPGNAGSFKVRFQNKGSMAANNTRIILTPGNTNITIPTQQYTFNPGVFVSDSATFNFTISSGAQNNCYVPATLVIKQDTTTVYSIPVHIPVGIPTVAAVLLNDNGSSMANWTQTGTASTWNTTTTQFNSSPSSFSESPTGNYGSGVDLSMTLTNPLNVSNNPAVFLSFYHRYATQANFDYCMVEVTSDNGATWQTAAEYSGTNTTWTQQTIDISRYANRSTQMKVRFRLVSNASTSADGWYVDDILITSYCSSPLVGIAGNTEAPNRFSLEQNFPNPFNPSTIIKFSIAKQSFVKLTVFDLLGRVVTTLVNEKKDAGNYDINFDATNLATGMYFYKLEAGDFVETKKMMLLK